MEKIFVYGTLRSGFVNYYKVLKNRVRHVEKGTITGSLYHLPAGYPAVIDGKEMVHGEVFTISQDKVMKSLDYLEGYMGEGKNNLYERRKQTVILENGNIEECWVYLYADEKYVKQKGLAVAQGDWGQFIETRKGK